MKPTVDIEVLERALLEVVGYAVASARTLLDETPAYGPLRLLESAVRTIDAMQNAGIGPAASAELRSEIEASIGALFEDEELFRARVDGLIGTLLGLD